MMEYQMEEIPRYRKKSRRKSAGKSDHKHVYVNCVFGYYNVHLERAHGFVDDKELSWSIGTYCPVCGKIGRFTDPAWLAVHSCCLGKDRWREMWTKEALREFDPASRTLPFFFLEDRHFQKQVKLATGETQGEG